MAIRVLGQVHAIEGVFDAGCDGEVRDGNQLELGIGLNSGGVKVLVKLDVIEIWRIHPGERVSVDLIAERVGELVPGAGAEDAPPGGIAEVRDLAAAGVLVQLIDACRRRPNWTQPGWSVPPTCSFFTVVRIESVVRSWSVLF